MNLSFKMESFRDDFTFRNSPEAIARFPFPFDQDSYRYSVNIEPFRPGLPGSVYAHWFDIDEHYVSETRERELVLEKDPGRCTVFPHMKLAQWDVLELLMEKLAEDYPRFFHLTKDGTRWTWENKPLGIKDTFIFEDPSTLPYEPFAYITRQAQGDFALMDHREGNLFMDGGMVTSPADWSVAFDLGMSFKEFHGPVPLAHEMGVFDRALKYLTRIQINQPVRRLNWTMTVNPRMDTSPETYPLWGKDRERITFDSAGNVCLRVELQMLFRLPRSNGLLFSIRTYLLRLEELVTVPEWRERFYHVLQTLPPEIVDYKGITPYKETLLAWLSRSH